MFCDQSVISFQILRDTLGSKFGNGIGSVVSFDVSFAFLRFDQVIYFFVIVLAAQERVAAF